MPRKNSYNNIYNQIIRILMMVNFVVVLILFFTGFGLSITMNWFMLTLCLLLVCGVLTQWYLMRKNKNR